MCPCLRGIKHRQILSRMGLKHIFFFSSSLYYCCWRGQVAITHKAPHQEAYLGSLLETANTIIRIIAPLAENNLWANLPGLIGTDPEVCGVH